MKCDAVIDKIKARVAAVDPNNRKVVGVFQLNIKAADGVHAWVVDLKDLKVYEGTVGNACATIAISDEDFIAVGSKQISVADAQAQGKAEITGDKALAAQLFEQIK